jgi:hypothetical protein
MPPASHTSGILITSNYNKLENIYVQAPRYGDYDRLCFYCLVHAPFLRNGSFRSWGLALYITDNLSCLFLFEIGQAKMVAALFPFYLTNLP